MSLRGIVASPSTGLWLAHSLPRPLIRSPPTPVNNDGPKVAFHTVRYGLLPKVDVAEMRARLVH
jgi:hypothetical protein